MKTGTKTGPWTRLPSRFDVSFWGERHYVITAESVKKASKAIDGLTKKQLDRAFARFFQEQPLVLEYVVRLSGHRDRIHELVMHRRFSFSRLCNPIHA
jgi:hypothetical protein